MYYCGHIFLLLAIIVCNMLRPKAENKVKTEEAQQTSNKKND